MATLRFTGRSRPGHAATGQDELGHAALAPCRDYTLTHSGDCRACPAGLPGAPADAEQTLKAWREEASGASRSRPADIKAQRRNAGALKDRRVVINVKGNDCRLIAAIARKLQIVCVKFVGAHKECGAADAETVEMS